MLTVVMLLRTSLLLHHKSMFHLQTKRGGKTSSPTENIFMIKLVQVILVMFLGLIWTNFVRKRPMQLPDSILMNFRSCMLIFCLVYCYYYSEVQTEAAGLEKKNSREAADGLYQDQVRFRFTAKERLSAPPHLQSLLHDGVPLLPLHLHVVNGHVTANRSTSVVSICKTKGKIS